MTWNLLKLSALKKTPFLIAGGVIGLVCLIQIFRFDMVERLERMTYDLRVRQALKYPPTVATNLGFVVISEETITKVRNNSLGFRFGLYWPRHIYGRALRELKKEETKAVAFDVLFADLRPDHATIVVGDAGVNSDEYFAERLREAGNAILAGEPGAVPPVLFRTNAIALGDISADRDSDGILRRAKAFSIYRKWNPAFQQIFDDPEYGFDLTKIRVLPNMIVLPRLEGEPVRFPLDKDGNFDLVDFVGPKLAAGKVRYQKPFTDERVWHMGIVLAAQQLKLNLAHPEINLKKGFIKLTGLNGVERTIPVDKNGYFLINWCMTEKDPRLTKGKFEDLLRDDQLRQNGRTNDLANFWHDKLVVIGSAVSGNDLTDRGATPLESNAILVSKHWNVANSIITGAFVHRSSLAVELLMICLLGVCAAFFTYRFRGHIAVLWILATFAVYVFLAFVFYVSFRYWMPIVLPIVGGLFTTYLCTLAYLVIFEQAERRRIRYVFSKVVAPNVVNELLRMEKLSLSGARRNVTVLFADIRGFTEMTDLNREKAAEYIKENNLSGEAAEAIFDAQARETLATVNLYLSLIADIVRKHDGTIDKFIGDCVMAFWGAPISNPRHALACVKAAVEIQQAVHQLNLQRETENRRREGENYKLAAGNQPLLPMLPVLAVGTGINTGAVTVGFMGSTEQLNYTVFGGDVNLASRLEKVSGRARIIISEATLAEIIQDDPNLALACVELPAVTVKGIRNAIPIFEVPWKKDQINSGQESGQLQPSEFPQSGNEHHIWPEKEEK